MPKASSLQKGNIVNIDNHPYQVKQIDVHTPSARGANTLYKVRYASLITGQTFSPDANVKLGMVVERIVREGAVSPRTGNALLLFAGD